MIQQVTAWIGFLGFLTGMSFEQNFRFLTDCTPSGLTSFLIVRMWFGKAAEDFNGSAQLQGVDFVASTSNAFTSE